MIESRINVLKATADAQQAELNGVERLGRSTTVNVDVTSSGSSSDQDDDWSLGEALDDARPVLEVIGGIGLVSLAATPRQEIGMQAPQTGQNQVSGISLKSIPQGCRRPDRPSSGS